MISDQDYKENNSLKVYDKSGVLSLIYKNMTWSNNQMIKKKKDREREREGKGSDSDQKERERVKGKG